MDGTFRYCQLKIRCTKLPGLLRVDPLAVVYTGGAGTWNEVGETEMRPNEWNPSFAQSVTLPADNNAQQAVEIRVDIYNKQRVDSRFLGTVNLQLSALIASGGEEVELALETPKGTSSSSRVFLRALQGYNPLTSDNAGGTFSLSLQLAQTQYWGVNMKVFYEISAAHDGTWTPVYKSPMARLDRQGWGQFEKATILLKDLCRDDIGTHLLVTLYRQRIVGHKKVLGTFQTSVQKLQRAPEGDLLRFDPNTNEDLLAADVLVQHRKKIGGEYSVGLKLVNVRWNAPEVEEREV